jgi:hypothetical protein
VFVRPEPDVDRRIAPLYESLQRSMTELWSRYSDQDLRLVLDFLASSRPILCEEIAKLRAGARSGAEGSGRTKAERQD